jgi:glucose dehydrogenase (acceptor)
MRFPLSDLTSLLFSILTYSSIIYYKQRSYDRLSARNEWKSYYDYIVVGAGSAGSTVAARLSEDPHITVLLIEAGGSETVMSNTPGLSDSLLNTLMDWRFVSTPQNMSCFGMKDQKCVLSSGRVIGGTSAINRMIYLRGNPLDFDNWEKYGNSYKINIFLFYQNKFDDNY